MASAKKASSSKASSSKRPGRTATATTAQVPPPPWPLISGICPGDFGLKAGFRDPNAGGPVTFREIVGWVTVENYIETMRLPFVAIVINDDDHPTMTSKAHMPDFIGYFKTGITASAAAKILDQAGVQITGVRGTPRTVVE
jgi:hypothetical protein